MATIDLHHDITPLHAFQKPVKPSMSELRTALAGEAGNYDLANMTRNDLIYACRLEGITLP